jgi:hypothetical protein
MVDRFSSTYLKDTKQRRQVRSIFQIIVGSTLVVLFGGYLFYQTYDWILGPELIVSSPTDGQTFAESAVHISGNAIRTHELTVNGIKIYADQSGNFSEELLLAPGIHTLEIIATNRLGKEQRVARQIVVK